MSSPTGEASVTVFAAASLSDAFNDLADASSDLALPVSASCGIRLRTSLAASSTLARQIDMGAPADIYVSANRQWVEFLASRQRLEPGTRRDVLAGRLVIVAPADAPFEVDLSRPGALAASMRGRIALGDPSHVPAGIYGKQALVALGQWESIEQRVVGTADVRHALMLAARGEVAAAVVYASDVGATDRVTQVAEVPQSAHGPVLYTMAIIAGRAAPGTRCAAAWLAGSEAARVFARHGFSPLTASAAAGDAAPAARATQP